jgi:ComF family protein
MKWGRFAMIMRAGIAFTDAILPPPAHVSRVRLLAVHTMQIAPIVHDLLGSRILTLMSYRDTATRDVIRALKYDASGHAAILCAGVLGDFLAEEIASLRTFSAKKIVLVPIPLHSKRLQTRGFNQIAKVLAALPQDYRDGTLSRVEPLLTRTRDTPHQTHLPRSERLKNVDGAFVCAASTPLTHTHIILIDDVCTTGATLHAAAQPLEKAGAKVLLVALARA